MANDRLYLVHKPSGQTVMLGRWPATADQWYTHTGRGPNNPDEPKDTHERLEQFFEEVGYAVGAEFCLETETEGQSVWPRDDRGEDQ